MDAREVLYTTRAMRRMKPDPIPDEVIGRILDAGIRAPAPGATQSWRFVVVTDRTQMAAIGSLWRASREALLEVMPNLYARETQARSSQYLHDHFDDVPVLVCAYGPPGSQGLVAPAMWSMCLAARAEGVGSTFTTLLTRSQDELNTMLGVPADAGVELVGAIPMGYPLGRWGTARRAPLEDVVFADRWGTPSRWGGEAGA